MGGWCVHTSVHECMRIYRHPQIPHPCPYEFLHVCHPSCFHYYFLDHLKTRLLWWIQRETENCTAQKTNVSSLRFFDIEDDQIARQLTLIDHRTSSFAPLMHACVVCIRMNVVFAAGFFALIKPTELVNCDWTNEKTLYRCPHVLQCIERFNSVSMWVATMILSMDTPRLRAKVRVSCCCRHARDEQLLYVCV